jgi:hypothetical protein
MQARRRNDIATIGTDVESWPQDVGTTEKGAARQIGIGEVHVEASSA